MDVKEELTVLWKALWSVTYDVKYTYQYTGKPQCVHLLYKEINHNMSTHTHKHTHTPARAPCATKNSQKNI